MRTTDPSDDDTDLGMLDGIAVGARMIGMGEASHGAHEIFTMKARVFEYLVRHQGFNAIAIEATMPETFALDTYVRTGVGDPKDLLSLTHFWTADTQEVLDLIAWMRQYNATRSASAQIGFYGMDMQYPGVAIDLIEAYVAAAMPSLTSATISDYACLTPYRNTPNGTFSSDYAGAGASVWSACTPRVLDVRHGLEANAVALRSGSNAADYARAVRLAMVVEQWEANKRGAGDRDADMADNAQWLLDGLGSGGKLFVWAHDLHIGRENGYASKVRSMGGYLDAALHGAYRPIGTLFATGKINAVRQAIVNGQFTSTGAGIVPMDVGAPIQGSYEDALQTTLTGPALIDLRAVPSGDARTWFSSAVPRRSVGSIYVPEQPAQFFVPQSLIADYDAFLYLPVVSPSAILKFVASP